MMMINQKVIKNLKKKAIIKMETKLTRRLIIKRKRVKKENKK